MFKIMRYSDPVVVKLIKIFVHQNAKIKIGAPQDLILISAVSGVTT